MHRLLILPATAVFALAIGCGSGGDAAAPEDRVPAGNVPAELVGTWHYELILDQTCDPNTGLCVPTSAQSETLTLTDDGGFEHVFYGETNVSGCGTVVLHESNGTAVADQSTLALHISEGVTEVERTCGEDAVTDEGGETDTYTWRLESDTGAPQLWLMNENGTELGPFNRQS